MASILPYKPSNFLKKQSLTFLITFSPHIFYLKNTRNTSKSQPTTMTLLTVAKSEGTNQGKITGQNIRARATGKGKGKGKTTNWNLAIFYTKK